MCRSSVANSPSMPTVARHLSGEATDHLQGVLDLLARSITASDPPDERLGHEGYGACYDPVQRTQSRPISLWRAFPLPPPVSVLFCRMQNRCEVGSNGD